jgi:hypothetical protein
MDLIIKSLLLKGEKHVNTNHCKHGFETPRTSRPGEHQIARGVEFAAFCPPIPAIYYAVQQ